MSPFRFSENLVIRLVTFAVIGVIIWYLIERKGDSAKAAATAAGAVAATLPIL